LQATTLIIVEGEKTADCVSRVFWAAGNETTVATTSPMGAENGHLWKEYLQRYPDIAEKRIIILPDNDEPGMKYAHTIATIFFEAKAKVKIVTLPDLPEGGDFVDWYSSCVDDGKDESDIIEALQKHYRSTERVTAEDVAKWKQDESAKSESTSKIKLTCLTDIEDREPEWFMDNKIPANDLTTISGAGGCGKTYFTCFLAMHVTNGESFSDGHPCKMGNVIIFPPEGQKAALKRRLKMNGVDLGKCFILEGAAVYDKKTQTWVLDPIMLSDCSRLEESIDEAEQLTGFPTTLLIIDPVMSFVGKKNPNYDNEVRQLLTPLQHLADRKKITIILVAHHGKAEHLSSQNQTSGSVAWVNVPRSAWQIYRDKEDNDLRYFAPAKTNDCIDPTTVSFRIEKPDGKVRIESMDVAKTADDFMNEQRKSVRGRIGAALNGNDEATDEEAEEIILRKIRKRGGEATVTDLQHCIKQKNMKKYFKADALERKLREMVKKGILTIRRDGQRAVEYFGIPSITEEK
jgi:KaiC/GvpD/RAD55 family RecA-like ATPase